MKTSKQILDELSQHDARRAELETELESALDREQQAASSIDVDATIKDFNARRNAAPNPLAGKR
jgi:hypothetical protein